MPIEKAVGTIAEKNPANAVSTRVTDETRVPMRGPELRLEIPEIEGYKCYWFLDQPGRIARALKAGWEFVTNDEVTLTCRGFADTMTTNGSTDLGNRVSVHGAVGEHGAHLRQYLMKIKKEWWEHDEQLKLGNTDRVVEALTHGNVGIEHEAKGDAAQRYSTSTFDLRTSKHKVR
jgi:hypothetical protein